MERNIILNRKNEVRDMFIKVIIAKTKHFGLYESKTLHVDIPCLKTIEVTVTDMTHSVPSPRVVTAHHVERHSYSILFKKSSISNY